MPRLGEVYLLRGGCMPRRGRGACLGSLPVPWHCGKATPLCTDKHVRKHYLPATSFAIGNKIRMYFSRFSWSDGSQELLLHV